MKNSYLAVAVVILGILGVGGFLLLKSGSETSTTTREVTSSKSGTTADDAITQEGRYAEYSKAVLDSSAKGRRVLYFYANWCPTCRPADANFKQNFDKIPEDLTLIRVNYNDTDTDEEERALAQKYGITYQHTYVQIDSAGREITKWNGGAMSELLANIK